MTESHLWFLASFALTVALGWGAYWLGRHHGRKEGVDRGEDISRALYRKFGIDVHNPNPDGSDYRIMNALDDEVHRARQLRGHYR